MNQLKNQTEFGLTFGQILSTIALLGAMITAYVSINVRIAAVEVRAEQLEKGRIQNAENIETIRRENRQDHQLILDKLDKMQDYAKTK